MGPYRTNAAPLRARREELRLEREDLEAKMTELEIARGCIDRAIDDIDVKLQTGFRPPRYRPVAGRAVVLVFAGVMAALAIVFAIGVALASRSRTHCVVENEPKLSADRLAADGRRPYP